MKNTIEYYPGQRMLVFRDGKAKIRKVLAGPRVAGLVKKRMEQDRMGGFSIN